MVATLIALLFLAVLVYVAVLVIGMIPLPEQLRMIVYIILAVVALVRLAAIFGIWSP